MTIRIGDGQYRIPQQAIKTDPAKKNQDIFQKTLKEETLTISNHAQKRLQKRGQSLAENDMSNLNTAVNELQEKGSENSLLLYKDLALIASVRNRTIITALDREELDTVTNIDSTKFVKESYGLDRKET